MEASKRRLEGSSPLRVFWTIPGGGAKFLPRYQHLVDKLWEDPQALGRAAVRQTDVPGCPLGAVKVENP